MKISRIDLDGASKPREIVERIFEIEPELPIPVPLEALCERLDIVSIKDLQTEGFEAALVTDRVKSTGGILVAKGRSRQRRRFSIGHELGHFLIPGHRVPAAGMLQCSIEQLRLLDAGKRDLRNRMEAEANLFAALVLMPPLLLQARLREVAELDLDAIVRLAQEFDVSKDAMARAVIENSRHPLAVIMTQGNRVTRFHRNGRFPWLGICPGQDIPLASAWHAGVLYPGETSERASCDPVTWISASAGRRVTLLTEQVLGQTNGFGMILLRAEMRTR